MVGRFQKGKAWHLTKCWILLITWFFYNGRNRILLHHLWIASLLLNDKHQLRIDRPICCWSLFQSEKQARFNPPHLFLINQSSDTRKFQRNVFECLDELFEWKYHPFQNVRHETRPKMRVTALQATPVNIMSSRIERNRTKSWQEWRRSNADRYNKVLSTAQP